MNFAFPETLPPVPIQELIVLFDKSRFRDEFMYNPDMVIRALLDLEADPELYKTFKTCYEKGNLTSENGIGYSLLTRHNEEFGHTGGSGSATIRVVVMLLRLELDVAKFCASGLNLFKFSCSWRAKWCPINSKYVVIFLRTSSTILLCVLVRHE